MPGEAGNNGLPGAPGAQVQTSGNTGGQTTTGGQAPSANPGQTPDLESALTRALTPLIERVGHLENAVAASRRTSQQPGSDPTTSGQASSALDDLKSLTKDQLLERVQRQEQRLQSVEKAEQERKVSEEKTELGNAVKTAISAGKLANSELAEMLLGPYVKRGTRAGEFLVDRDGKVQTLAEAVAALGARPEFKPAAPGDGAGATTTSAASGLMTQDGKPVTPEMLGRMSFADRKKLLNSIPGSLD